MITQIVLDTTPIQVENFSHTTLPDEDNPDVLRQITFDFEVTSDMYHEITTLLNKNDFMVTIPGKNIHFEATISKYYTNLTNLYEANQVAMFHLELIEKSNNHLIDSKM